ncbi:MAG TPA: ATP-binding protein [Lacipirellulaceae bacterium]|nr:ATP-binding protein [Lacipirellulaceae bacterium]
MSGLIRQKRPHAAPPLRTGLAGSLLAVLAFAFVRLYLYPDRSVPLTYALPLLMGIWHKRRPLHWGLTAVLAAIAGVQVFGLWGEEAGAQVPIEVSYLMMLANIGIVALVVDWLIIAQRRLQESFIELERANEDLEASNRELSAREEEISSQNEQLQAQSHEMEHQMEELQQQSEELQQQSEELLQQSGELQLLNEEGVSRQRVLEALLETSTAPVSHGGVRSAAERICEAALDALGRESAGVLIVGWDQSEAEVLGACGVQLSQDAEGKQAPYRDPFVLAVIQERRIAAIEDLATTPEVAPPKSISGARFQAALAAPIVEGHAVVGAIVLYSITPCAWSQAEFKIAAWLAAQSALVLLSARLQHELDRRREEAEQESQRKTRFLAAVSHDVRTPANAISLTAEVIKQAGDDPAWAHEIPQLAEALRSNAKLLVELVSDVLDLARFDSGKVEVDPSDFCLQDMVGKEVMQYQALAATAGLRLEGATDTGSIWLRIDRMKLARVLSNLIGNAIKFTERGHVEVRCSRGADGAIEIHVSDSGVGIHPLQLENIFDEFYQIKNQERDRSKGTGLGLAICKRLVDAMGCTLSVQSRFGEGTTFTIRIPKQHAIEPPAATDDEVLHMQQQPQQRLRGLRVLLVEDHEDTRVAFSRLLGAQGATVDLAHDGREALRILGHHPPDAVLLDLMLPDMDGREVLRHLSLHRPANLRCLLAVSGDVSDARRREVESLGADGLVAKPLQIGDLVERICTELQASAASAPSAGGSAPPTHAP